ncbi:MAG: hypothetical protein ABI877_14550, partial [Gemmatimonadaceae bacterium]
MKTIRCACFVLGASATLLGAPQLRAQLGSGDGFLFRVPTVRVALSGGYAQPRGRSDIYDFVTNSLTLERRDFGAGAIGASAEFRVTPRMELGLNASFSGRSAGSQSRHFVGDDDLPVEQTTSLLRAALMATGRLSLVSPGRAVGRYAWIPTRVVPFIGGGVGPVWYRLRQNGEFVDDQTLDIFEDTFESTAFSAGATAFGGADLSLTPHFGMTAQGRYLWAKGAMNHDFSTFNKI